MVAKHMWQPPFWERMPEADGRCHVGSNDGKGHGWLLGCDGGWLGTWRIPDRWLRAWLQIPYSNCWQSQPG
eukprot:scaffold89121_cov23-Cyclotella_meneghiniana.AAC.1